MEDARRPCHTRRRSARHARDARRPYHTRRRWEDTGLAIANAIQANTALRWSKSQHAGVVAAPSAALLFLSPIFPRPAAVQRLLLPRIVLTIVVLGLLDTRDSGLLIAQL